MNDPVEVTIQFVFPGEGAILYGTRITPDMPAGTVDISEVVGWGKRDA